MRIGTWNLEGRWDQRHREHIVAMRCDILLLTEVPERVRLPRMEVHFSGMRMAEGRRWAAVASRLPLRPLADPHGASAMAEVGGLRVCTSILPWRTCGRQEPWTGSTTAEKTRLALTGIEASAPALWGGDWNHALTGREWSGSLAGRRHILETLDRLGLRVATADAPHQIDGLLSIDHVAVPATWTVLGLEHHPASSEGVRISDHDSYVIEVGDIVTTTESGHTRPPPSQVV